jgi:hypothetical protein
MYDTTAILEADREEKRFKRAKQKAIDILWITGMIPVEEYLFLCDLIPSPGVIELHEDIRRSTWKDSSQFQSDVIERYIDAGKVPSHTSMLRTKVSDHIVFEIMLSLQLQLLNRRNKYACNRSQGKRQLGNRFLRERFLGLNGIKPQQSPGLSEPSDRLT